MKNIKEHQLRKCIFMELDEYKDLIDRVTDGLKAVEYELGLFYMYTEKAENTNTYWNEHIEETLSKYFDITVTSIHADDYDDVGVWIVYK